ncbi:MAG: DUF4175 domain-containing protein [Polyangiaceae bacterium]
MVPEPTTLLASLHEAWRRVIVGPRRRAVAVGIVGVVVVALLVARRGTGPARIGAATFVVLTLVTVAILAVRERRAHATPNRMLERVTRGFDEVTRGRALRALDLVDELHASADGTSDELKRLHVARTLGAISPEAVAVRAKPKARVWSFAFVVGLVVAFGVLVANPLRVFEGADVLVARDGVAPVDMPWVVDVEVSARPPEYLHREERILVAYRAADLPRGTLVTFHAKPLFAGRALALQGGAVEVPFVDDGAAGLVARWPLAESVDLRVVARFGNVVIREPLATSLVSIADEAPAVDLEGAPKRIRLAEDAEGGDVPVRYVATDDHGLREVHVVLRTALREERRVLARLDGETRSDRGGYVLRARDPFVKKSHSPVEITVEAKDNDPITGPKWGRSQAITLIPPDVGEPEARRIEALRELRDAYVDLLAWRIENPVPSSPEERKAYLIEEVKRDGAASDLFSETLARSVAGLQVPARVQAILMGQVRKLRESMAAESKAISKTTHDAVVKANEKFVLVTDGVLRGLGQKDARTAARQLADVADDLALGASQMQRPAEKDRGGSRVGAARIVLVGGGKALRRLGSLGRDLGEIVDAGLGRVDRGANGGDWFHAELAARDLAARLHEPDPSFGARGHGGRGGGESGFDPGSGSEDGEGEGDAERAFNEAAEDLEKLAMEHAGGIGNVERALNQALSPEEQKALADETRKHADAVRDAVRGMPSVGSGSDSWTSKGAAAREHADSMARALEQGGPADAVTAGKNAENALDEARRIAQREKFSAFGGDVDDEVDKRITDARRKLEAEVKWAEQKLDAMRKRAAERAQGDLARQGDEEEKLAERASRLGDKGRDQGALPAPALESLEGAERAAKDAARSLKRGDADKALAEQREAQRLLEMAKESLGNAGDSDHGDSNSPEPPAGHGEIPKPDAHKGPEEFRKRVVKGLGQSPGGRLSEAVRRYAEGLLR